jgi:hypothetical protein
MVFVRHHYYPLFFLKRLAYVHHSESFLKKSIILDVSFNDFFKGTEANELVEPPKFDEDCSRFCFGVPSFDPLNPL